MSSYISMSIHRFKKLTANCEHFPRDSNTDSFRTLVLTIEYEDFDGGKHKYLLTCFCRDDDPTQAYVDAINAVVAAEPEATAEPQS